MHYTCLLALCPLQVPGITVLINSELIINTIVFKGEFSLEEQNDDEPVQESEEDAGW